MGGCLAVLGGRHARIFLEGLAEAGRVIEIQQLGDLADRVVRAEQQLFRLLRFLY